MRDSAESQPNHETGANRATFGCAIFLWYGGASKARFRKRVTGINKYSEIGIVSAVKKESRLQ